MQKKQKIESIEITMGRSPKPGDCEFFEASCPRIHENILAPIPKQ